MKSTLVKFWSLAEVYVPYLSKVDTWHFTGVVLKWSWNLIFQRKVHVEYLSICSVKSWQLTLVRGALSGVDTFVNMLQRMISKWRSLPPLQPQKNVKIPSHFMVVKERRPGIQLFRILKQISFMWVKLANFSWNPCRWHFYPAISGTCDTQAPVA